MTTALHALFKRRDLANDLYGHYWRGLAKNFVSNSRPQMSTYVYDTTNRHPDWVRSGDTVIKEIATTLQACETYTVTPEMFPIVDADADAWEDDLEWTPDDLPSPTGFLWVPQQIQDVSVDGWPSGPNAICWHYTAGRLRLVILSSKHSGVTRLQTRPDFDAIPDLVLYQIYDLDPGPLPASAALSKPLPDRFSGGFRVWLEHDDLQADMTPQVRDWIDTNGVDINLRPDRTLAWLFSAFRIMAEPLAAVERHGLPANLRRGIVTRRLKRNLHVTVISFRRRTSGEWKGGTFVYSHRFYRRGHSRRQWYKTPEGEWAQRRVWIRPTIVGDPSLPLLLREHVNALVR